MADRGYRARRRSDRRELDEALGDSSGCGADWPRHELVNGLYGQTIALDALFDVGGSALAFPGDRTVPQTRSAGADARLYSSTRRG